MLRLLYNVLAQGASDKFIDSYPRPAHQELLAATTTAGDTPANFATWMMLSPLPSADLI
jgi:hypothetical protein